MRNYKRLKHGFRKQPGRARGWADEVRHRAAGKAPVLHEDRQLPPCIDRHNLHRCSMSVMGTDYRTLIPSNGPEAISTVPKLQRNPVI
jgi:hypothetical protein